MLCYSTEYGYWMTVPDKSRYGIAECLPVCHQKDGSLNNLLSTLCWPFRLTTMSEVQEQSTIHDMNSHEPATFESRSTSIFPELLVFSACQLTCKWSLSRRFELQSELTAKSRIKLSNEPSQHDCSACPMAIENTKT